MSDGAEVPGLDRVARESFVEWVSEAMVEAAREGAVLVEMRFGASWVLWPDFLPRFREAEGLTKARYPGFWAEALISGYGPEGRMVRRCLLPAWTLKMPVLRASTSFRCRTNERRTGSNGVRPMAGRRGRRALALASQSTPGSSRQPTSAVLCDCREFVASGTPFTLPTTLNCWRRCDARRDGGVLPYFEYGPRGSAAARRSSG